MNKRSVEAGRGYGLCFGDRARPGALSAPGSVDSVVVLQNSACLLALSLIPRGD